MTEAEKLRAVAARIAAEMRASDRELLALAGVLDKHDRALLAVERLAGENAR